jgi:hypothetical protein
VPRIKGPSQGRGTIYPEYITSPDPALERQLRVALLVDYPVLLRAVRAIDADAVPRLADIVRAARELGAVYRSRAYGAWYDIDEATAAFTAGLDPVFVPPLGPGSVPTTQALLSDGQTLVASGSLDFLALSGDDRLLPLMQAAEEQRVPVVLIAHACQPEGPCVQLADSAIPASEFLRSITRAERYRRPRPAA